MSGAYSKGAFGELNFFPVMSAYLLKIGKGCLLEKY